VRGVLVREQCDDCDGAHGDLYASQAFVRWRFNPDTSVVLGRQLLTWGPALFRSPSNPFYFDAGRTQPLRELSGIDAVQLSYLQPRWSWYLGQVLGSGHVGGREGENFSGSQTGRADYAGTTLLRAERRDDALTLGGVAALQRHGAGFVGAYAAWTIDDAWMAWGEVGEGRRPAAIESAEGPLPAYEVEMPSPRAATALAGASYTFESGQSVQGEYLYDGHGLTLEQEQAYFATARQAGALLGGPLAGPASATLQQGLQYAPASLSRHYLAFAWQSSPQDSRLFWRAMWTLNLVDHSHEPSYYVEYSMNRRISWLANVVLHRGDSNDEFGSLLHATATVGMKLLLF
jgi:hypothetical protein